MKKKVKQKKDNSERWLLTYSDLITLLMALFILMYSMSNVDQSKYEKVAASLNKSLGSGNIFSGSDNVLPENGGSSLDKTGGASGTSNITPAPTPKMVTSKQDMGKLENNINNILKKTDMGKSSTTTMENRGLTITLANDAFFESGSAEISSKMQDGLDRLSKILARVKNPILIEGHTDNVPISRNGTYSSNWQLSAARAANVADYLNEKENIKGSRLRAVGYGEFHPVASNDTVQGKKKNRRVEITVLYNEDTGMMFNED